MSRSRDYICDVPVEIADRIMKRFPHGGRELMIGTDWRFPRCSSCKDEECHFDPKSGHYRCSKHCLSCKEKKQVKLI